MIHQASAILDTKKSTVGDPLVGNILDKRYVVLEEVGPDGKGIRYLVYDMTTLKRTHVRVEPEGLANLLNTLSGPAAERR